MAVLHIRRAGDPVLRSEAEPLEEINDKTKILVTNMKETMIENDGVGLAAPQVGILKRIIVYQDGRRIRTLINPTIVQSDGEDVQEEGCLSLPGYTGMVKRAESVHIEAKDLDGKAVSFVRQGLVARILQHEIDHLDGVLFTDHAVDISTDEG